MKTFKELGLKADIRQEKKQTLFFLPGYLTSDFTMLLKNSNISFNHYSCLELMKHKVPAEFDIAPNTIEEFNNKLELFTRFGCNNATAPTLIVSHCNTDDLFRTAQQFFGPTMNENYKQFLQDKKEQARTELIEHADDIFDKTYLKNHGEDVRNGKITIL